MCEPRVLTIKENAGGSIPGLPPADLSWGCHPGESTSRNVRKDRPVKRAYQNPEGSAGDLGGPDLDDAAVRAVAEMGAQILTPLVVAAGTRIEDAWPASPNGGIVPRRGRQLFRLARRAYRGDFRERVEFLEAVGARPDADAVLSLESTLRPTFAPLRLDRRTPWETFSPGEASEFLRRRLESAKRKAMSTKATVRAARKPHARTASILTITCHLLLERPPKGIRRSPAVTFTQRTHGPAPIGRCSGEQRHANPRGAYLQVTCEFLSGVFQ
jgi:hypothetical protein